MGKKKEKVTYYDDGRTVADMSALGDRPSLKKGTTSSFREIWRTYWDAVKMMLLPLLVVAGGIGVCYLIVYLIFRLQY